MARRIGFNPLHDMTMRCAAHLISSLRRAIRSSCYTASGPMMSFHGFVDNAFVYSAALDVDDLNFLRSEMPLPLSPVARSAGYALRLNGPSSRQHVIIENDFGLLSGFSQITIASWVKLLNPSDDEMCVVDKSGAVKEWRLSLVAYEESQVQAKIHLGTDATTAEWALIYNVALPRARVGLWFHLAMAWNGTHVSIICDGIPVNTRPWTGHIPLSNGGGITTIGAASMWKNEQAEPGRSVAYFMSGLLDELQIWRRGLTSEDLGWLDLNGYSYQQPLSINAQKRNGLAAHWTFNEGRGTVAKDDSAAVSLVSFLSGTLRPSAASQPQWSIDSPDRLGGVLKTTESVHVSFTVDAFDASLRRLQVRHFALSKGLEFIFSSLPFQCAYLVKGSCDVGSFHGHAPSYYE